MKIKDLINARLELARAAATMESEIEQQREWEEQDGKTIEVENAGKRRLNTALNHLNAVGYVLDDEITRRTKAK